MTTIADIPKGPAKIIPTALVKPVPAKLLTKEELLLGLQSIPNLVEVSDDEVEHVLLYGEPGTSKTTQAGLLAEFLNVLWFDGDKGLTALLNALPKELRERIHVIKIPDSTQYPVMVSTMLKVITGRQVNICMEHGRVDCPECKERIVTVALNQLPKNWVVVMDSQTQFVASALALSYWKLHKAEVGKQDIDDFWRGVEGEMFAYWGGVKNVMDKLGSYIKDLKCQFISISHETMVKMEDNVTINIAPVAGSDNSSRGYAKYYGSQVHCRKINGAISFTSGAVASNRIQTKTRSGVYLEKQVTPGLIHLFRPQQAEQLLKGSYTEWYLKEGWKDKSERKSLPPAPKGVLEE